MKEGKKGNKSCIRRKERRTVVDEGRRGRTVIGEGREGAERGNCSLRTYSLDGAFEVKASVSMGRQGRKREGCIPGRE